MTQKILIPLILIPFIFCYCANTNADKGGEKGNIEYEITSFEEQIEIEASADENVENVYDYAKDFIKWYIENRDSLLRKRENIVQINNENYFYVDTLLLEQYLNFIKTEGANYFSQYFIQEEKDFWLKVRAEAKEKPVLHEDSFDPWSFEADPVFNGHEWPESYNEWIEDWKGDIDKSSIEINGDTASFEFEFQRFMVREEGRWKMKNWGL